MPKMKFIVSVDDAHLSDISSVAKELREAGVEIEDIMDTIGVIIVSCDTESAGILSHINGVTAVEEERDYQLSR